MLTVMLTETANSSVKQQIPFNVWQKAYNRFLNQVYRLTSGECSATILREIDLLGIELRALRKAIQTQPAIHATALAFCDKAVELIESEHRILLLRLRFPSLDANAHAQATSPLYLSPQIKPTDLVEIITPLFELGLITTFDGQPAKLTTIVKVFEKAFNVSMPNYRILRECALSRKKCLTPLLDKFKAAMERLSQM